MSAFIKKCNIGLEWYLNTLIPTTSTFINNNDIYLYYAMYILAKYTFLMLFVFITH